MTSSRASRCAGSLATFAVALLAGGCAGGPAVLAGAPDCPDDPLVGEVVRLQDVVVCGPADVTGTAAFENLVFVAAEDVVTLVVVDDLDTAVGDDVGDARAAAEDIALRWLDQAADDLGRKEGGRTARATPSGGETDLSLPGVDEAVLFTDVEVVVEGESWTGHSLGISHGGRRAGVVVLTRAGSAAATSLVPDLVTTLRPAG